MPNKLDRAFYEQENVVAVAKSLLGKYLVTHIDGVVTGGMIVETEAYSWTERGCHAYNNCKTPRNAPMFERGGCSYVYLCYGVHEMFNVVTNAEGIADAVLIRALEPTDGLPIMLKRSATGNIRSITAGPGKLARALGINRRYNAIDLQGDIIWIEDRQLKVARSKIEESARIGLNPKWSDSLLPWRFTIKDNLWVSKR